MNQNLERILQKALIDAQKGNREICERGLIKALVEIKEIPFESIHQALRKLKPSTPSSDAESNSNTISSEGESKSTMMSLVDQAEQLKKDLDVAHEKKSAEVNTLQGQLEDLRKKAQDELHQFKKAEEALAKVNEAIESSLQTRRAHQQAIQGAVEGISYSQMISLDAREKKKRLDELDVQLQSLLSEADQILLESITERKTQISEVRRKIAQSASAR